MTLQGILQAGFAAYAAVHKVPRRVWRAARAVLACRTAALGGHVRQCPARHVTEVWYNSCRHRACPRCCLQRISPWLDGWQQQLLPTDHFHVIFTLPNELHELWRWNRERLTEVLFSGVRETLVTRLSDPKWLGAQPGILAALHTWSRTLAFPPHVHCLVSGGGLTVDGQWQQVGNGFLLPVAVVRALLRGKVLGTIEALWLSGRLQEPPHYAEDGVRQVLREAARLKWNIRIAERYPHGRGVVKYLARSVCTDGFQATRDAWRQLFPHLPLVLCFLHSILKLTERWRGALRTQVLERAWFVYPAVTKGQCAQRLRRLGEWGHATLDGSRAQTIEKMTRLRTAFPLAYECPQAARTTNAVDRVHNQLDRPLYAMPYCHGHQTRARLAVRAWTLQWNFHPYGSRLRHAQPSRSSPFADLNGFHYHSNWLQNLWIASSMGGLRL